MHTHLTAAEIHRVLLIATAVTVMFASAMTALTFRVQRAIAEDPRRTTLSQIAAGVLAVVDLVVARLLFQIIAKRLLARSGGSDASIAVTFVDVGTTPTILVLVAITVTWAALARFGRRRAAGAG